MRPTDKFRTDLDQAIRRAGSKGSAERLAAMRAFLERSFRGLTGDCLAALLDSFAERWEADQGRATTWLAGVGSIILMDYDGTPFTKEEWAELRDAFSLGAGELDLELLGYAMGLVVEHGAL